MIPSLLQIPSAVSDSKLHSVLPNNGKGDFQFDRSTGATRINRDGLIEEVGYFSSELVQNGNFSELGSELVTNGDFATDSNWTKGGGWSISGGKASALAVNGSYLLQNINFTNAKTYKIQFDISNYISGEIRIRFSGGSGYVSTVYVSGNNTHTLFLQSIGNTEFRFQGVNTFTGSIDNVSVKQVDPNDRWTLGTGWSFGDGVANAEAGSATKLTQTNTLNGKKCKVTLTVSNYVGSGLILVDFGSTVSSSINSNGTHKVTGTYDANNFEIFKTADFAGSITDISVIEIQGDRPRLSYDITNGVVEDKPHLLLEPSSTNLVDNSLDFFSGSWSGTRVVEGATIIAPNGNNEAHKLIASSVNNTHYREFTVSSASAGSYTGSCFFKKGEYSVGVIRVGADSNASRYSIYFSLEDGSFIQTATVGSPTGTAYKIDNYGSGWYRLSVTITHTSGDVRFSVANAPSNYSNSNGLPVFLGNSSDGGYAWGAQIEVQSYATSYIPTAGTTITRAAETCNNSGNSEVFNDSEGVLFANIAALSDDLTQRALGVSDGTSSNRMSIVYNDGSSNSLRMFVTNPSGTKSYITNSFNITQNNKISIKLNGTSLSFWVNGFEIHTDTLNSSFVNGTLNTFDFAFFGTNTPFYGKTKDIAYYDTALTDLELETLTSYRNWVSMVNELNLNIIYNG